MIKEFNYKTDKDTNLSEHFKVKEFCDEKKNIIFDTDLIYFLECIYTRCKANKIVITSGYRSVEEDLKVGGNGKGYHTKGKAVDFKVYDKHGKPLESKYVCCVAQLLGLKGIAKINDYAVHIDLRTNGYYFGDETKGTNSVTKDFYNYFDLTIQDVLFRIAR